MAAALDGRWKCLETDCPEAGQGSMSAVNKAAEKHERETRHSTLAWAVLTLPIQVPGR